MRSNTGEMFQWCQCPKHRGKAVSATGEVNRKIKEGEPEILRLEPGGQAGKPRR